MQESILHYIWQFQKFNQIALKTENAEPIQVLKIGNQNTDAGPDFANAKIKIGDVIWAGNIEIHIKSSDWLLHNHDKNLAYDSVILHVVWENDKNIYRANGQVIPTLSLKNITDTIFFNSYQNLINNEEVIPCYSQWPAVNYMQKITMFEKALVSRLERKASLVIKLYEQNNKDWEETTYQLLAKAMGFGLNAQPFEKLARCIPLKIIQKHSNNLASIEATFFGTAGFLNGEIENSENNYIQNIKKEYEFIKSKYSLTAHLAKHEWKYMRLRPNNFPTIRISQFAQIISKNKSLFSAFINAKNYEALIVLLKTEALNYWKTHYDFNKLSDQVHTGIGKSSIENLIINAVAPLLVAVGMVKNEPEYLEKALDILQAIPPENNKITRFWKSLNQPIQTAFDSQSSIEMYNEYCNKKACLNCNIGVSLLQNK